MREFVTALRQLRFPIVMIAVAVLVMQTLVAGLTTAHAAARIATFGADAVICHGNGDDGSAPAGQAAHECCTFCTATGPAALSPGAVLMGRLAVTTAAVPLSSSPDRQRSPRAIRAGPSQAPPTLS